MKKAITISPDSVRGLFHKTDHAFLFIDFEFETSFGGHLLDQHAGGHACAAEGHFGIVRGGFDDDRNDVLFYAEFVEIGRENGDGFIDGLTISEPDVPDDDLVDVLGGLGLFFLRGFGGGSRFICCSWINERISR